LRLMRNIHYLWLFGNHNNLRLLLNHSCSLHLLWLNRVTILLGLLRVSSILHRICLLLRCCCNSFDLLRRHNHNRAMVPWMINKTIKLRNLILRHWVSCLRWEIHHNKLVLSIFILAK
jgi:hypothetical protein